MLILYFPLSLVITVDHCTSKESQVILPYVDEILKEEGYCFL